MNKANSSKRKNKVIDDKKCKCLLYLLMCFYNIGIHLYDFEGKLAAKCFCNPSCRNATFQWSHWIFFCNIVMSEGSSLIWFHSKSDYMQFVSVRLRNFFNGGYFHQCDFFHVLLNWTLCGTSNKCKVFACVCNFYHKSF